MRDSYNWRLSSERKKEMKRRVPPYQIRSFYSRNYYIKKKKPIHIVGTLEEQQ
jgi:hypothetical protein